MRSTARSVCCRLSWQTYWSWARGEGSKMGLLSAKEWHRLREDLAYLSWHCASAWGRGLEFYKDFGRGGQSHLHVHLSQLSTALSTTFNLWPFLAKALSLSRKNNPWPYFIKILLAREMSVWERYNVKTYIEIESIRHSPWFSTFDLFSQKYSDLANTWRWKEYSFKIWIGKASDGTLHRDLSLTCVLDLIRVRLDLM